MGNPFHGNTKAGEISSIPIQSKSKSLISAEVQDMLRKGAVRKVPPCQGQVLSNIFLREKKEGTFRPIIDLKQVNCSIAYQKFKMESLKEIRSLLQKGDYMIKIDLKDAYYSIPLDKKSGKFVRIESEEGILEFVCLMFGLGPGPRIFTKLMKIPVGLLRKLKIRLIIYIDDMLIMASLRSEIEL